MKKVEYRVLRGRSGQVLSFQADEDSPREDLSTYALITLAARRGPSAETKKESLSVVFGKLNKALDVLEPALKDKPEYVVLDDDWWGIIKSILDVSVPESYRIHSTFIEKDLAAAVTEYTPPPAPKTGVKKKGGG